MIFDMDLQTSFLFVMGCIFAVLVVIYLVTLRGVVPPKYADVVTRKGAVEIYSADKTVTEERGTNTVYYQFPWWMPFIGVIVTRMSLENMEIKIENYQTFAKGNARFTIDASVYCRVNNVLEAAQRFPGKTMTDFKTGIQEIIIAAIRKTTANFAVEDVIAKRSEIADHVLSDIKDDMLRWGVEIINVSIVDFKDSDHTSVIHDISAKKEAEINSLSRQEIATRKRQAEISEVEAYQAAQTRKIEVEESVGKREEEKNQVVSTEKKRAVEKAMDVERASKVMFAEIEADAKVRTADGEKRMAIELAEGEKQKLELTGRGEGAKIEAMGSAEAEIIRKKGTSEADVLRAKKFAEAEGLDKYADAQRKQQEYATAIRTIEKDERIGLALAEALANATIKYYGSGKPEDFMDLFTPKGGLSTAGSFSTLMDIVKESDPDLYSRLANVMQTIIKKPATAPEPSKGSYVDDTKKATVVTPPQPQPPVSGTVPSPVDIKSVESSNQGVDGFVKKTAKTSKK
jgi:flotillin